MVGKLLLLAADMVVARNLSAGIGIKVVEKENQTSTHEVGVKVVGREDETRQRDLPLKRSWARLVSPLAIFTGRMIVTFTILSCHSKNAYIQDI